MYCLEYAKIYNAISFSDFISIRLYFNQTVFLRIPIKSVLSGRSSGVERNLAKVEVEGSNPFARSKFYLNKSTNSTNPIATKRKPCTFLMSNIFV